MAQKKKPEPDAGTAVAFTEDTLMSAFAKASKDVKVVLPKHLTPERLIRVAWTLVGRTPKLRECTPQSLAAAMVQASTLGLELGREAHLVPYGRECVMIPDYKGLMALARRSGTVRKFHAYAVYEGEHFEEVAGTEPTIVHKPSLTADHGWDKIVAAYAVATLVTGETQFVVLPKWKLEKVRKASRAGSSGPWKDWPEEQVKKTAVKNLCKGLEQSPELAQAIELDNRFETGHATSVLDDDDEDAIADMVRQRTIEQQEDLKRRLEAPKDEAEIVVDPKSGETVNAETGEVVDPELALDGRLAEEGS